MALAQTNPQVVTHGWSIDFGEIGSVQLVHFSGPDPRSDFTIPLSNLTYLRDSVQQLAISGPYLTSLEEVVSVVPPGFAGDTPQDSRYVVRIGTYSRDVLVSLTGSAWAALSEALDVAVARDDRLPNNAWDSTVSSRDALRGFYPALKRPGEMYAIPGLV